MDSRGSDVGVQEERPQGILGQLVKDPSRYSPVKKPGSFQPSHLFPPFSADLVLLTLPNVVNPLSLINCEVVVGGRKDSLLVVEGQKYRVATYPVDSENTSLPSLFLPDQDGQLTKVTSEIKACLVLKGEVEEKEEDENNCVDIAAMHSIHYKAPKDLKRRDFFSKTWTRKATVETDEPGKRRKKSVGGGEYSIDEPPSGDVPSPRKKKKKRTSVLPDTQGTPGSPAEERRHRASLHSEELASHIKKQIKEENTEAVNGDLEALPSKMKKKVKREVV